MIFASAERQSTKLLTADNFNVKFASTRRCILSRHV